MESMNNKDPFETFLERQRFSEKASESLRRRLDKSAVWNLPQWKDRTTLAIIAVGLIIVASFLLAVFKSAVQPCARPDTKRQPVFEEPAELPKPLIAHSGFTKTISPFRLRQMKFEPEFNLSFIDRPVNFLQARREYSDLI